MQSHYRIYPLALARPHEAPLSVHRPHLSQGHISMTVVAMNIGLRFALQNLVERQPAIAEQRERQAVGIQLPDPPEDVRFAWFKSE